VVVENKGVFEALGRSNQLSKGNRWRILGVGALIFAAATVAIAVLALLMTVAPLLGIVAGLAFGVAVWPYVATLSTVLYVNLVKAHDQLT